MTNRDAVVVLLQTRTAWIDPPRSQFARFGAVPGEKPTVTVACPRCDLDGMVTVKKGERKPCPNCDGKGTFQVDSYTRQREDEKPPSTKPEHLGNLSGPQRETWRAATDAKIAAVKQQLKTPLELASQSYDDIRPERWERERDWHFRHGDYRALDLVLEGLSGEEQAVVQVATWTHEYQIVVWERMPAATRKLVDEAVDLVADRMVILLGRDVRVPARYRPKHPAEVRRESKRMREAA